MIATYLHHSATDMVIQNQSTVKVIYLTKSCHWKSCVPIGHHVIDFPFSRADGSMRRKKSRPQASLTATHSSTLAEEIVAVLRTLHSLGQWSGLINEYINAQLSSIGDVMAGRHSEAVRRDVIVKLCHVVLFDGCAQFRQFLFHI